MRSPTMLTPPRPSPARLCPPARRCVLNVCRSGEELICAGYTLYSSSTILVLTVGALPGLATAKDLPCAAWRALWGCRRARLCFRVSLLGGQPRGSRRSSRPAAALTVGPRDPGRRGRVRLHL